VPNIVVSGFGRTAPSVSSAWGTALCERIGSENFKLLYDIYHMQIQEGGHHFGAQTTMVMRAATRLEWPLLHRLLRFVKSGLVVA
jgi:hypothetical protein